MTQRVRFGLCTGQTLARGKTLDVLERVAADVLPRLRAEAAPDLPA